MVSRSLLLVGYFYFFISCEFSSIGGQTQNPTSNLNSNNASVSTATFNGVPSSSSDSDCSFSKSLSPQEIDHGGQNQDSEVKRPTVVLNLNHLSSRQQIKPLDSVLKDSTRIQTLHTRIIGKKNQNTISRLNKNNANQPLNPIITPAAPPEYSSGDFSGGQLIATLESGVSLGSGEYFMDVFIGTPPHHYSMILDTGSDLNWIQCLPCHDCFDQTGPYYNPKKSSSYRNISCNDPRCGLVSSPEPPRDCNGHTQSCPYYYWYGDSSNTTGDFSIETFTVNLTGPNGKSEFKKVDNVMFGCGHWNRGLFHGAAGLLGLGRGPLSFSSQLQSLYGHSFSYCLVDRNSNSSVSSKLIFGEDKDLLARPELNFTALVGGKENPVDTFYYVQIKSIIVGGEVLDIPSEIWDLSSDGGGGTIIDSGTTLGYFADRAYKVIKEAFVRKVKGYPVVQDFLILDPCYNVSGVGRVDLPSFEIVFGDGAIWNFPVENYFIKLEPDEVVCLAILGTPSSGLSIIGNYQQQNFHVLYDTERSRLGFAPTKCADM
ncbi:protein aspartic protease in guard cell 1 [Phtheirospermum japonicum]|uniref:Protein aspartic protease in guard cell 1 n=1 Tax=Phtheirospermum japonicum TaxID=374723 RepID=A0A830CZM1_9LAMI|nr:protein aspartic protease in guard cell 1 [Phtheirospermum japonicum]